MKTPIPPTPETVRAALLAVSSEAIYNGPLYDKLVVLATDPRFTMATAFFGAFRATVRLWCTCTILADAEAVELLWPHWLRAITPAAWQPEIERHFPGTARPQA